MIKNSKSKVYKIIEKERYRKKIRKLFSIMPFETPDLRMFNCKQKRIIKQNKKSINFLGKQNYNTNLLLF